MNNITVTQHYASHKLATHMDGLRTARKLQAAILAHDLDVPATLKTPLPGGGVRGSRITALLADLPTRDYLAEAAELIRRGESPDEALALHAGKMLREQVAGQVADQLEIEWLRAFDDHADLILEAFRAKVFNPLIQRITEAVDTYGAALDVDQAVQARDFKRAEALAGLTDGFEAMATLRDVRMWLHGDQFTGSAAWILEPLELNANGADVVNALWWAHLVQAGYTPHFPTLSEYLDTLDTEEYQEHAEATRTDVPTFALSTTGRMSQTVEDFE